MEVTFKTSLSDVKKKGIFTGGFERIQRKLRTIPIQFQTFSPI